MNLDQVLNQYYNIESAAFIKLEGYGSTNYRLDYGNQKALLKIYADDTSTKEWVEVENEVLNHLASGTNDAFPVPILNTSNKALTFHEGRIYRMLTFLEGDLLAEVNPSVSMFESFGAFLGRMNQHLLKFRHPVVSARKIAWDLQHFSLNRSLVREIDNLEDRKIVEYFFLQYEVKVMPGLHYLRMSTIHNDANDHNVLVNNGKISGIIDFGDMVYGPLICELAIALTYAIMGKEDPIKWAISILKSYHHILPILEEEVEILYYLIAARLCTSVCQSARAKKEEKDTDYILISERPAWALLRHWLTINPTQANNRFKEALGLENIPPQEVENVVLKRHKVMGHGLSLSYAEPIYMERAAFQYMYDAYGNTFLDAYNNIPHVGHEHPRVVQAGIDQMIKLNTNTRYLYDQLYEYAEQLLVRFPSSLNRVYFVNSGSAASDLAIRMARNYTGRSGMMIIEHGYHGNTQTGIQISHYKYGHKGGAGKSEMIIESPLPDTYRGEHRGKAAGVLYAQDAILRADESQHELAAFMAEPVVGCGGQVPLADGYLQAIYPAIRQRGGLCISDEVQTGFGRLGSHFWGFEYHGVIPDMVVLGKPMGNGHPIGAVVTTDAISEAFDNGMEFFSSFGGNPVSCAIGKSVLEIIEEEELQQNARTVGDHFLSSLRVLQSNFPVIGDVRGSGLFLGVEFINDLGTIEPNTALANHIKNELRRRHILVSTDGPYENVIKMKPPLCFSKENADRVVDEMNLILAEYKS